MSSNAAAVKRDPLHTQNHAPHGKPHIVSPASKPDLLAEAAKLMRNRERLTVLHQEMLEIQSDSRRILNLLDKHLVPDGFAPQTSARPVAIKPRSINDKISIAAGRAIGMGKRKGFTPEKCLDLGIAGAKAFIFKQGAEEATLTPELIDLIKAKVEEAFQPEAEPTTV